MATPIIVPMAENVPTCPTCGQTLPERRTRSHGTAREFFGFIGVSISITALLMYVILSLYDGLADARFFPNSPGTSVGAHVMQASPFYKFGYWLSKPQGEFP